jgi:hypothetical protein
MTALTVVTGIVSCLTACFLMAIFVGKAIAARVTVIRCPRR